MFGSNTGILDFDLEAARNGQRIGQDGKDNRDLLIYLLWQVGQLSGYDIGEYFGLSYSAVSRRVKIISERLGQDRNLSRCYNSIKSLIKV